MFEGLLLPWQQIYHLAFLFNFSEQLVKFPVNFTLLKYFKSQRSSGFLITKELIFGFQILDLKDHFSASLNDNYFSTQTKNSIKFELWASWPHLTIHHYLLSKMIFPALILVLMLFGRYYINLTSISLTTD